MRLFFQYAFMRSTVLRALKVACVITPILTVFNHYDKLMVGELGLHFWFQVVLTFIVPYCVSTYSAAMAGLEEHQKTISSASKP